jgi:hypothetical protein
MGVCRPTFYISPLGHVFLPPLKVPPLREPVWHTFYGTRHL